MASENIIAHIQAHADLVGISSKVINLTAGRRTLRGDCPFHKDQANSFMVSPEKNIFKCFGCGKEGGPIEFVMDIEQITHAQAVEKLASVVFK
ncbi:CHC2 zinc finger domain-containing protein [Mucilaginibacter agri]|uniref:Zinc finger CHC2-type domain-containing protein n=1 Tax=Mucilaginibacter agri TaxID=2695265 RepID=A0A965ZJQ8_9SPHI|nr:CHC2 zinc finger domain-containing protein [Mucilaginibacter agri]NCD72420.1 hypothetical protein [Mucilaginibacter agri]